MRFQRDSEKWEEVLSLAAMSGLSEESQFKEGRPKCDSIQRCMTESATLLHALGVVIIRKMSRYALTRAVLN